MPAPRTSPTGPPQQTTITTGTSIAANTGEAGATSPAYATNTEQSGITAVPADPTRGTLPKPAEPTTATDPQQPPATATISTGPAHADLANLQAIRAARTTITANTTGAQHPGRTTSTAGPTRIGARTTETTGPTVSEGQQPRIAANTTHTANTRIADTTRTATTTNTKQPRPPTSPTSTPIEGPNTPGTTSTTVTQQPPTSTTSPTHSTVIPEHLGVTTSTPGTTTTEQPRVPTGPTVLTLPTRPPGTTITEQQPTVAAVLAGPRGPVGAIADQRAPQQRLGGRIYQVV